VVNDARRVGRSAAWVVKGHNAKAISAGQMASTKLSLASPSSLASS
jgi:hypothetical protein